MLKKVECHFRYSIILQGNILCLHLCHFQIQKFDVMSIFSMFSNQSINNIMYIDKKFQNNGYWL